MSRVWLTEAVLLLVQGDCCMLGAASLHTSGLRSSYLSYCCLSVSPDCSGYYHLTSATSRTQREALVSLFLCKEGRAGAAVQNDVTMFNYLLVLLNTINYTD